MEHLRVAYCTSETCPLLVDEYLSAENLIPQSSSVLTGDYGPDLDISEHLFISYSTNFPPLYFPSVNSESVFFSARCAEKSQELSRGQKLTQMTGPVHGARLIYEAPALLKILPPFLLQIYTNTPLPAFDAVFTFNHQKTTE